MATSPRNSSGPAARRFGKRWSNWGNNHYRAVKGGKRIGDEVLPSRRFVGRRELGALQAPLNRIRLDLFEGDVDFPLRPIGIGHVKLIVPPVAAGCALLALDVVPGRDQPLARLLDRVASSDLEPRMAENASGWPGLTATNRVF